MLTQRPRAARACACYPAADASARSEVRRRQPRGRRSRCSRAAARTSRRSRRSPGSPASTRGRSTPSGERSSRRSSSCATASASAARRSRGAGRRSEDASALKAEMKGVADRIKRARGAARGGRGRARARPAGRAQPARRQRARGPRRRRRTSRCAGSASRRAFDFAPKAHWDLGPELGILDFERAAKISGARFAVYWGAGARLERALIQFMLDLHTRERGLPRGDPALPGHRGDAHRHRPAPEVRGGPLQDSRRRHGPLPDPHRRGARSPTCTADEILEAGDAPAEVRGASRPASAREAGSYGKDVRGLIRQHQFHKVELVKLADARDVDGRSSRRMVARRRGGPEAPRPALPRRRALRPATWASPRRRPTTSRSGCPGQNAYREISSCSNCTDFQARRASLRYRPEPRAKPRFVHTLNGSGLAVGPHARSPILENYQQADGSVVVPEALRPYMGGLERITRR